MPAAATARGPVNVAVVDGADVVCTITNRHKAMMTVVKQVVNEAGEVDTEQLFTFTPEPGAPFVAAPATTFALADDGIRGPVSTVAFEQDFVVTETPDADYTTTSDCEGDDDSAGDGNEVTFRPDPGDDIVCTFTNTRKTGQLEVVKMLDPATDPGSFDLLIDGNVEREAAGHDDGTGPVLVETGDHTVAEEGADGTDPDDYNTTLECFEGEVTVPSEGGVVAVGDGANIACIFTNTRKMGQLTVNKVTVPTNDDGLFDLQIEGETLERAATARPPARRSCLRASTTWPRTPPARPTWATTPRRSSASTARRSWSSRRAARSVRHRRRGHRLLHVHQHPEPRADHRAQGADPDDPKEDGTFDLKVGEEIVATGGDGAEGFDEVAPGTYTVSRGGRGRHATRRLRQFGRVHDGEGEGQEVVAENETARRSTSTSARTTCHLHITNVAS